MKKRKNNIIALGILLISLLLLSSCKAVSLTPPDFTNHQVHKLAKNKIKIGVSLSTLNNPFFISLKKGITQEAKSNGSKVQLFDAQNDSSKQNNDIEDLIQKKVNVIIINPVDSDAIVPAIKDANAAGIPVIACDRGSNGGKLLTTVASNNVKAGKMAADFMKQKLNSGAKIAELEGTPGADAAIQRGNGFNKNIKGHLKLVTKQSADFDRAKGMSTMENILQAHPNINGVFSQNDEMALGAIKSINNPNLIVVSIDGEPQGLKAVKQGTITGIIAQEPKVEGQLAVKAAYNYYSGKHIQKIIHSPIHLVTKNNVDKYLH